MIELAALAVIAVAVLVVLSLGLACLKLVLWAVLLPMRMLLNLVFLPFLLLNLIFGGLLFLVAAPVIAIAMIVALLAVLSAVLVPLLPVLCMALVIWVIVRASNRSTAIVRS